MLKSGLPYCILFFAVVLYTGCKSDVKSDTKATTTTQAKEVIIPVAQEKPVEQEVVKLEEEKPELKQEVLEKKQEKKAAPRVKKPVTKITQPIKKEAAPAPSKVVYAKPAIQFETTSHDFGKLEEGETYDYAFKFKNTGTAPLEITSASGTCGCAQPSFPFLEIPPGGTNQIGVHYNSVNKEGDQNPEIYVTTNINDSKLKLTLTGTVIVTEERRKEKEAAIAKQKASIAKAAEEAKKRREAQEKITKARVDSILQAQKDTLKNTDPEGNN